MSYYEAIEDNIRTSKRGSCNFYYPRCHICGKERESMNYIRGQKYTCDDCKLNIKLSDKERQLDDNYDIKEKKYQKAISRIAKNYKKLPKRYERAFKIIHDKLHKHGWFDSTEEIMVAIELVSRGIKARHQVKFGRYKADFVLPDLKVVLEVDGHVYHTEETRKREIIRDDLIILHLGPDWEVVRITDTLINENVTKLIKAINAVLKKRNKIREKYNGTIPDWYSRKTV